MEKTYTWNKGLLASNYELFSNGMHVGLIDTDIWKNEAKALINNQQYHFKSDGVFSSSAKILDQNFNILGTIKYHTWQNKCDIFLANGEQFNCNFNNWYSKWNITNFKDKQISYNTSNTKGFITTNFEDDVLLVAGLYVKQQYNNLFVFIIFIAVFMTIIL